MLGYLEDGSMDEHLREYINCIIEQWDVGLIWMFCKHFSWIYTYINDDCILLFFKIGPWQRISNSIREHSL